MNITYLVNLHIVTMNHPHLRQGSARPNGPMRLDGDGVVMKASTAIGSAPGSRLWPATEMLLSQSLGVARSLLTPKVRAIFQER
jgi:hypothetical protein